MLTPDQVRYRREAEKRRRRKREAYRKKKGTVRAYVRRAPVIGQAKRPGRTHGLRTTYNAGCRCRWCCMADSAYRSARYHARAA